jgi:hypothetical protein
MGRQAGAFKGCLTPSRFKNACVDATAGPIAVDVRLVALSMFGLRGYAAPVRDGARAQDGTNGPCSPSCPFHCAARFIISRSTETWATEQGLAAGNAFSGDPDVQGHELVTCLDLAQLPRPINLRLSGACWHAPAGAGGVI